MGLFAVQRFEAWPRRNKADFKQESYVYNARKIHVYENARVQKRVTVWCSSLFYSYYYLYSFEVTLYNYMYTDVRCIKSPFI